MRKFSLRPILTLRGRKFKGLRGWSGKPLHPPLTDIPIAAYILGASFDALAVLGRNQTWGRNVFVAGGYLFIVGLGVSVLAVITGVADRQSSTTKGTQVRRTANTHAAAMMLVTALALIDVILRLNVPNSQNYPSALILVISLAVALVVAVGATLGGSLVYEFGFNVETASDSPAWQISETDVMPGGSEPVEKEMSPADRLAGIEVAVTNKTVDPLADTPQVSATRRTDDIDADAVRSADEIGRLHIWAEWVATLGSEEASRRWLAIFAATDAPRTG